MEKHYKMKILMPGYLKNYLRLSLIALLCVATTHAQAQQIEVKGVVKDEQGLSIPGVIVMVQGSPQQKVTNTNGQFTIQVPNAKSTLVFRYVGFIEQQVTPGVSRELNVVMKSSSTSLNQVVVVGYGTQKKKDVTGAISTIKLAEQLETMPQTNLGQALQGRMAGVSVVSNGSSAEGGNNSIQVRGRRSLTASNGPLVILDGVPYAGSLSELSPDDIESLDVLKDASSAAIYGARAANGVILVTTKKGKTGKARVTYNSNFGIDEVAFMPKLMDGPTFYKNKVDRINQAAISPTEQRGLDNGTSTNWVDVATRTGSRQQHSLGVSGGSDDTHYYLSGNYNDTKGIAKNDRFKRITLRLNLDSKINSWITIGTNTQFGSSNRDGEPASFSDAFAMNPLISPYNADGSINIIPWPEDQFFKNPLEGLNIVSQDRTKSVITNNFIKVDLPFVKGLSYRANTGYTYQTNTIEKYYGRDTKQGFTGKGQSTVSNQSIDDWLLENIVNYNRSFGKHTIDFTGLYSSQKRTIVKHELTGVGFPSDIQSFYQNGIATTLTAADTYTQEANISQMGRLNYSYNSKYLITLTARRDGFSGFGDNTKFGVFPVLALGWNISEETFMKKLAWLDNLKLRTSYGKVGNQAIGPYSTLPQLSEQHNLNTDKTPALGYRPNRLGDPSLGWESTLGINLGIDFAVLKNRINGSVDFFSTKTSDLLLDKSISPVNGVKSIRQNIGATNNRGLDIFISSVNVRNNNFSWTTDLNFSTALSKIDNVGLTDANGNYISDIGNRWFIGEPTDVNYGYVFDGIWQTGDNIAGSAQPAAKPGDIKVKDVSGPNGVPDGIISATYDRVVISSRLPDYTVGLTNSFSYKNFSLSFFIRAVQGLRKSNSLLNTFFDGRNGAIDRQFWTPDIPINTYPANREDANPLGVGYFDDKTSNASFIRLQDVSLSYALPKRILEKIKLSRLQFFVNAKNLVTITDWTGLDPEFDLQNDRPQLRSYLIGLRTQF